MSMAPPGGVAPQARLALAGGDGSDTTSMATTMTEADALDDDGTDTVLHAVSEKTLWLRMREFNACVPYTGLPPDTKIKEETMEALASMLPQEAGTLPTGSAAGDSVLVLQVCMCVYIYLFINLFICVCMCMCMCGLEGGVIRSHECLYFCRDVVLALSSRFSLVPYQIN